jgi:SNF2 family DNA or RNA helicase
VTTSYHAKYIAHELTKLSVADDVDRLSMSLFNACVDLNPHQIEAALFALRSPLAKGAILADEVGLGKTIESGLVLCQYWCEQRRKLLVICPASLRKQWAMELQEKFNIPSRILDSRECRILTKEGVINPLDFEGVVILSYHFANRIRGDIRALPWDLVVIDEAHKLRNAYRPSNKLGQGIRWATEDKRKILLTATPLQNSLLELYGLSTLIDEMLFGDAGSFRSQYMSAQGSLEELRSRLGYFCTRHLRRQLTEYIQYTERHPLTQKFSASDNEQKLHEAVSAFMMREDTYSIPRSQRHLTILILYKLLASSSHALAGTLDTMRERLERIRDGLPEEQLSLAELIIQEEEIEDELLDFDISEDEEGEEQPPEDEEPKYDRKKLDAEIEELRRYSTWARSIGLDTKTKNLQKALDAGFAKMTEYGAKKKALIFTESRRTQDYLKGFLEANGYTGQVVAFNGTNSGPEVKTIYENWVEANKDSGRVTGSRAIDSRTALIDHFRDNATIMIATEAGAEGVNLQFCSLVINYDMPWNPQRIEQRIGRCHRYGQKHDVVVINFLNERNHADKRVLELLEEKFQLFSGVFGASDEVLGSIESGVDFEKRVLQIVQKCRNPEEIEAAFAALQDEMQDSIAQKMAETRSLLLEHFDEDVHTRLKGQLDKTKTNIDRISRLFWSLTKFILAEDADFNDADLSFLLLKAVCEAASRGRYHLIRKDKAFENVQGQFLYRMSHPLGEHVIATGKEMETPLQTVSFDISSYPAKISVLENLKGNEGWLVLEQLTIDSFRREQHLLFSAFDRDGHVVDAETCRRMFDVEGVVSAALPMTGEAKERLDKDAKQYVKATLNRSLENNNRFFQEERERLEKWAQDMEFAAEDELKKTKAQIRVLEREARQAVNTQEQHEMQEKIAQLEKKKRKQRQEIFDVEDEIREKRDKLIDALERQMAQKSSVERLFAIKWKVV